MDRLYIKRHDQKPDIEAPVQILKLMDRAATVPTWGSQRDSIPTITLTYQILLPKSRNSRFIAPHLPRLLPPLPYRIGGSALGGPELPSTLSASESRWSLSSESNIVSASLDRKPHGRSQSEDDEAVFSQPQPHVMLMQGLFGSSRLPHVQGR